MAYLFVWLQLRTVCEYNNKTCRMIGLKKAVCPHDRNLIRCLLEKIPKILRDAPRQLSSFAYYIVARNRGNHTHAPPCALHAFLRLPAFISPGTFSPTSQHPSWKRLGARRRQEGEDTKPRNMKRYRPGGLLGCRQSLLFGGRSTYTRLRSASTEIEKILADQVDSTANLRRSLQIIAQKLKIKQVPLCIPTYMSAHTNHHSQRIGMQSTKRMFHAGEAKPSSSTSHRCLML